ncbi:MAG: RnfABCDGE type electron transport complex subunit D [Paracoccaceae bacterium]
MRFPGRPEQVNTAPFMRFGWDVSGVTLAQTAALVPPLIAAFWFQGAALSVLVTALLVTLIWEVIFALIRHRRPGWHGITTALIFVIMAPDTVPLWQVAIALSFGTVLGELIFGGRGFGFLNAAAVSLAFLVFSFPATTLPDLAPEVAFAVLPGAILMLAGGLISWRVLVAAVGGFGIFVGVMTAGIPQISLAPAAVFVLVFIICDPVAASVTKGGRWLYGGLVSGLTILFNGGGASFDISPEAVIFAALLGSIFAPLLDDVMVRLNIRKRRRRHG